MTQKELREQNRAAVIRAAQGRFLAQSIDKTTIAEIAEDADLTPMSVYRYFGSKQAIAVAVANHLLDAYLAEHSARCEATRSGAPENGYETFSRVLGAYIDTYEAHPEYIRFLQDMAFYALREQLTESVRYMCFSRPVATGLDKPGREALVRGIRSFRIDTHPDNGPMRALLVREGFACRGKVRYEAVRLAYEKPILG